MQEERHIEIAAKPLETATLQLGNTTWGNITWAFVFYESGLEINIVYSIDDPEERAVGFKLSEGMEVPKELEGKLKFAQQQSKLAGTLRGSYFDIKGAY
jgi:hypothetical protein